MVEKGRFNQAPRKFYIAIKNTSALAQIWTAGRMLKSDNGD